MRGDGERGRDFVHVNDVVQANLLAATNDDAVGDAFKIGSSDSITIRELAETIQTVTDSDSDIAHVNSRKGDLDRSEAAVTSSSP